MRAASLKPLALCTLGALLGGAAVRLALHESVVGLQESEVGGSRPAQTSAGNDTTPAAGGIEAPRPFERAGRQEAAAVPARMASEVRRRHAERVSAADTAVDLAARDPGAAMDRAFAIESHWLRLDTIERVTRIWAEREPDETLAFIQAARGIDPGARSALRARALEAWAAVDPGGALAYLLGREGQNLYFFDTTAGRRFARALAAQQPHELLYAADAMPKGAARAELRGYAIAKLVERDLAFALREATLTAPGHDRRQWLTAIERVYPGRTAGLEE